MDAGTIMDVWRLVQCGKFGYYFTDWLLVDDISMIDYVLGLCGVSIA